MNRTITIIFAFAMLFMLAASPASATEMLNLHFDTAGATTPDSSANSFDATISDATHLPGSGVIGGAFQFDGDNDYLEGSFGSINQTYSIAAWIRPTGTGDIEQHIFAQSVGGTNPCPKLMYYPGSGSIAIASQTGAFVAISGIPTNSWTHVVATSDANFNETKLYVNGAPVNTGGSIFCIQNSNSIYRVGRSVYDGHTQDFNGTIDEVLVHDDILSAQQVENLYETGDIDGIESSDVSVEFFYDPSTNLLRTQGYAPAGAATVLINYTSGTSSHKTCEVVTQGTDPEFSHSFLVDGTWANESYNLFAEFWTGPSCDILQTGPAAYGGEFDWLKIQQLMDDLDDLGLSLDELEALLNATNATLQNQIDALQVNVSDLQDIVLDATTNITVLQADVAALQTSVDDLWDAIGQLNHGRINLIHNDATENLRVRLYFPFGATEAELYAYNAADDTLVHTAAGTIIPDADGAYNYDWDVSSWDPHRYTIKAKFVNGTGSIVGRWAAEPFDGLYILQLNEWLNETNLWLAEVEGRLNDVNETVENHTQWLSDLEYNLTLVWEQIELINGNITELHANDSAQQAQIDDLIARVIDLEDRMDAVEEMLDRINHATINLAHLYEEDSYNLLNVWGEAPEGATTAYLAIYEIGQIPFFDTPIYEDDSAVTELLDNDNAYYFTVLTGNEVDLDDSAFGPEKYNVFVFFDTAPDYAVSALFDDLLLLWLEENQYGFDFVDTQTFETWNPQDDFTRKLSFGFMPEDTGEFWFELEQLSSNNGENVSKVFPANTCDTLNGQQHYTFPNRNVLFPPVEGSYAVRLVAHDCDDDSIVYRSNRFRLIVDDLTNPWNLFGVTTVVVDPIYDQFAEGVYWTGSTDITLLGLLDNDTPWQSNRCEIRNYVANGQYLGGRYQEFDTGAADFQCWVELSLGDLVVIRDNGAPEYDVGLCGQPGTGNPECYAVTIGYDVVSPTIDNESLNPGVQDTLSGLWNFSAIISDNGVVETVEFYLINKTDGASCYIGSAVETAPDLWEVTGYDTSGGCTVDGYYNFTVVATDFAGNIAELSIDPVIDNTDPTIIDVVLPQPFLLGVENLVQVLATDNLVGIDSVTIELAPYTCGDNDSVCSAEADCTSPVVNGSTIGPVALSLVSGSCSDTNTNTGNCRNGTWEADLSAEIDAFFNATGWTSPDGVWFEYTVLVNDSAANDAVETSDPGTPGDSADLHEGFELLITSATPNPVAAQASVSVQGTLTSALDNADMEIVVVNSVNSTPVLLGIWQSTTSFVGTGTGPIAATYTSACGDVFTDTTTVQVVTPSSGGSGGGGGGGGGPSTFGASNPTPENEESSSTNTQRQEDDNGGSNTQQQEDVASTGGEEQPPAEEPETQDLLTGAVVGGGNGQWIWLGVLLALIGLGLGGYYFTKK